MQIAMFKSIYEYNHWADERLLQTVATLDEAGLYADMPNGVGSIHVTLVHMVSGLWVWRQRWEGNMPNAMLSPADFPTLESIVTRYREEERQIHDFLATLHDEDLARGIRYSRIVAPDKVFVLPLFIEWKVATGATSSNSGRHSKSHLALLTASPPLAPYE